MSYQKMMSLVLKCLGFYCLVRAVEQLPQTLLYSSAFSGRLSAEMAYLPLFALLMMAYILIFLSERLASKFYPDPSDVEHTDMSMDMVFAMFISILGLVLLAWKVPERLFQIVFFANAPDPKHNYQEVVQGLVQLGMGLLLLVKSPWLVRMIVRIKSRKGGSQ